MNRFAHFVVNHKLLIGIIFLVIVIGSIIGLFYVKQNSDIQSYLSKESITAKGRNALFEHFNILGEMSFAVKSNDEEYLNRFIADIGKNDIIKNVMWYGNYREMEAAIEANPSAKRIIGDNLNKLKDKYLKPASEGNIYLVSLFLNISSTDDRAISFVDETEKRLADACGNGEIDEFAMGGMAVNSKSIIESSLGEIPKYMVIAVLLLLIILFFTTKSWMEPFIFIITLGISIIINMGTNVIFNSVSTITFSASTILQLALAMDYTIFLMHCYYDEIKRNPLASDKICMERAIPKTMRSITASALTTIGGFIALLVMDFGIGIDLGLVLAKGVLISLITVMFLQPVLLLAVSKPLKKMNHKYFTPAVTLPAKVSLKHRVPIVALALLLIIPTFIGQLNVPLSYMTMTKAPQEPTETEKVIEETANQIIFLSPGKPGDADASRQYEFIKSVDALDGIGNGISLYSIVPEKYYPLLSLAGDDMLKNLDGTMFSEGFTIYIYEIHSGVENEQTYSNLAAVKEYGEEIFGAGNFYITGLAQAASDMAEVTPGDFVKVSCISAAIIFLILLLSFRSFKFAALLLTVIELGIWINLSLVTLIGIKINFMSYLIISSVQLGATVDYAILAASKYREVRGEGERDFKRAIVEGYRRATPSIFVSAAVLISVCVAVYFISANVIISEITLLIAAGAAMSTLLVITLLPAALGMTESVRGRRTEKKLKAAGVPERLAEYRNMGLMPDPDYRANDAESVKKDKPKKRRFKSKENQDK